jgi:hypothetical protein
MIEYYKSKRPVDGKLPIWVIVDETGNIVNRNPSKEELKGLDKEPRRPRDTRIKHIGYCDICREKLVTGKAYREHNKEGKETGIWLCEKCYKKYDPNSIVNIIKSIADRRIGNIDPNSTAAKGDNSQELACILYEWEDLNKKYDNYKSPIDCYDTKTGLYHQVKGRHYNSRNGRWPSFGYLELEWEKIFETMICFCFSENWKTVERIYKFPKKEIDERKSISIYKNPMNNAGTSSIIPWYEKYRVKNEDELKRANEIWKEMIYNKMR